MSQPSVVFFRPDNTQSFCIDVPLMAEGCADISCSTMIKTFAPKREATLPPSSSIGSTTAEAAAGELTFKTKGRTNPYENIIERLERKYASQVFFEEDNNASDEDDDDEDDDDDEQQSDNEATKAENVGNSSSSSSGENGTSSSSSSSSSSTATNSGPTQVIKKNKKKRNQGLEEYYDMDDGFVDDTEELALANVDLKRKKLKTKHGGFFVSSGELEVFRMDSSPGSDATVLAGQGQLQSKGTGAAAGEGKKMKKSGTAGDKTNSNSNGSGSKGEGAVRVKIPWVPKPAVAAALDQLQTDYQQCISNSKDSRSSSNSSYEKIVNSSTLSRIRKNGVFPPDTEARLFTVHQIVRKEYGTAFPPGYLDRLVDVLGGGLGHQLPTGRLKNLLTRLDYRESAAQLKAEKEALTEELEQMIPGKVMPFEATAKLLAVMGKKKQQQQQQARSADAAQTLVASPTDDVHVDGAVAAATAPSSSSSSSSAAAEGSTTVPGGGRDRPLPLPLPLPLPAPPATTAAVNEIDPELASYIWQVRWDASMKSKLLKLEQVSRYTTLYILV